MLLNGTSAHKADQHGLLGLFTDNSSFNGEGQGSRHRLDLHTNQSVSNLSQLSDEHSSNFFSQTAEEDEDEDDINA